LLESNGIGWQSYSKTIEDQDREFQICVAGQTVTTEGKSGFVSAELFSTIRSDLIQSTGDDLAYTVNTQVLPAYVYYQHGEQALLTRSVVMEWDTTPPKDLNATASSLVTAASAIKTLTEALAAHNVQLDVAELCAQLGVPTAGTVKPSSTVGAGPKLAAVEPVPAPTESIQEAA
jgi:phage gp29-like protein